MTFTVNTNKFSFTKFGDSSMWMNNETGDFFELNSTSTFIVLSILDGSNKEEDLILKITNEFEIDPEEAKEDLKGLLEELMLLKIITQSHA